MKKLLFLLVLCLPSISFAAENLLEKSIFRDISSATSNLADLGYACTNSEDWEKNTFTVCEKKGSPNEYWFTSFSPNNKKLPDTIFSASFMHSKRFYDVEIDFENRSNVATHCLKESELSTEGIQGGFTYADFFKLLMPFAKRDFYDYIPSGVYYDLHLAPIDKHYSANGSISFLYRYLNFQNPQRFTLHWTKEVLVAPKIIFYCSIDIDKETQRPFVEYSLQVTLNNQDIDKI